MVIKICVWRKKVIVLLSDSLPDQTILRFTLNSLWLWKKVKNQLIKLEKSYLSLSYELQEVIVLKWVMTIVLLSATQMFWCIVLLKSFLFNDGPEKKTFVKKKNIQKKKKWLQSLSSNKTEVSDKPIVDKCRVTR